MGSNSEESFVKKGGGIRRQTNRKEDEMKIHPWIYERCKILCQLEEVQMTRGSIGIAYWMNTWMCPNKKLKNVEAHPNLMLLFNEAWIDA
jgi:hypothetical protein